MINARYVIEQEAPGSALYMVVDTTETRCTIAVASHCTKDHAELFAWVLNQDLFGALAPRLGGGDA